ncbi:bifunctional glycosyltransferase family 2/GtrA family protein [Halobacillus salinarum]|uniref:Bifunctional glycosyltransferase family 2/GtrA family protein n=1 Tax=Halobacillus salinarum TaxID=2932257 RepID=A0ABY4ELI7_9BACI|nr:bifunctional glycosyltransferase family 2/GtrA family protein [Halobacillus salinarum]UOQ45322.1 bifunctional glycosyltransferase family 2/GtrA family protein [Halobacillus salinarum]
MSVVIPAYNPDHKLLDLLDKLIRFSFHEIVVINDGSHLESQTIFDKISKEYSNCVLLEHPENKGKGRALKTAFQYYKDHHPEGVGMVTADADGQHSPEDIKRVAEALIDKPEELVLGVRDFTTENIPFRSRFGNNMTKSVLRLTSGMKVTDTQTGLRGIPREFGRELLYVEGDRYEFEMRMILACKTYKREISEVEIETIYIDENESSHFNPIVDSIKIYYVFLRFLVSSAASFLVDIGMFALFSAIFKAFLPIGFIVVPTILARIVSSLFNYFVNRNIVFKSYKYTKRTLVKYYALAVVILAGSSAGVHYLYEWIGDHEVLIKLGVDSVLFLFSFYIQKAWVFDQSPAESIREVEYE